MLRHEDEGAATGTAHDRWTRSRRSAEWVRQETASRADQGRSDPRWSGWTGRADSTI